VILDGTLLRIDRVAMASGRDRPYYSGKHKTHGVNVQVLTDPAGRLIWASPALPGARHDMGAATEHGILDALNNAHVQVVADKGYQGAGPTVHVPQRRRRLDRDTGRYRRLSQDQKDVNTAHARPARARRAGQRPTQELEDPPPDPLLPDPGHQARQRRPSPHPRWLNQVEKAHCLSIRPLPRARVLL
jgi:hypothetical protein